MIRNHFIECHSNDGGLCNCDRLFIKNHNLAHPLLHYYACDSLEGGFCDCGLSEKEKDSVNNPAHYNSSQAKCSGCEKIIECIDVTRHMSFSLGNAMKYIWRCEHKGKKKEDIEKAIWYLNDELFAGWIKTEIGQDVEEEKKFTIALKKSELNKILEFMRHSGFTGWPHKIEPLE